MKFLLNAVACATAMSFSAASSAQTTDSGNANKLEEIVVIGTDQSRYITSDKGSLTGLPLEFLELPRVVNIISEQLVLDRKITDLNEALRNTPGITESDGFGGTNDDFLIRGFRPNLVYRNGFRRATNLKTNLTNVAYTQVIRGPGSITYGQVEPGGLVDVVTKTPLDERRIAGEIRVGSFDDELLLIDFSEPLSDTAGVRLVASTQDSESFRDLSDISRDTLAISGKFELSESTRIDVSYEYREESRPLDRGTITVATANGREIINNLVDIPIERRFGEEFEEFESEFEFFETSLTHDLGHDWTLRLGVAREESRNNDIQARPLAAFVFDEGQSIISPDGFITVSNPLAAFGGLLSATVDVFDDPTDQAFLLRQTDGSQDTQTEVTYVNALINGEFETGNITHRIAIGVDYLDLDSSRFFATSNNGSINPQELLAPIAFGAAPLFNVQNPIFGNLPDSLSTVGLPLLEASNEEFGVFINDYIELTDKFSVLLGLRYDDVESASTVGGLITPTSDGANTEFDSVSPQLGLNYKLSENASLFASYSESISANGGFLNTETSELLVFDPEESNQIELGIKAEFFNGKLQTTAAIYSIEKANVVEIVDRVPFLRDGQTSEGLELTISGQPIPGMNIVAGYSYNDSELADEDISIDGNRPTNVADDTFNLWASYELQTGALEGLGLGGGVFHSGDRFGDNGNSFSLGSYTLADASAWYTLAVPGGNGERTVRLQIAGKNLFDEEYFTASGGPLRIGIGAPRSVVASVSFDF